MNLEAIREHSCGCAGADRANDIALTRCSFVSSAHARTESDCTELSMLDLNSRNGTFVNEQPLRDARRKVDAGDVVRMGRSIFELERV